MGIPACEYIWCLPAAGPGSGNAPAAFFPRDDVLQSGGSGFSARSLLCQGLQNPPSQEAEGGVLLAQAGWRLSGKEASLEAVVGVWKRAKRREMEMMRLQSFEVLSLKEK